MRHEQLEHLQKGQRVRVTLDPFSMRLQYGPLWFMGRPGAYEGQVHSEAGAPLILRVDDTLHAWHESMISAVEIL
jgi:hypothetical protein